MGNSHKNLLFRNHWDNCTQTLVEWSLDGPLPKMCPVIPTSNQDVRQAKNRKRGMKFIKNLLWNYWTNLNQILLKWSLGGPLSKSCPAFHTSKNCVRWSRLPTKMSAKLKIEKRGKKLKKNLLLWNYWANLNQTLLKLCLGGPLPKLCLAFQTSDQDGRHSRT